MSAVPNINIFDSTEFVAQHASRIIYKQLSEKPDSVIGLSTGSTPEQTYCEIIRTYLSQQISWSKVRTVNLDEYCGLEERHPQSYRYYMQTHLFDHIDINSKNTLIPNGMAMDPLAECKAYENTIYKFSGVDLWLLGIGSNGHIAFNEPGSTRDSRTRLVNLTTQTISDNSRFFACKSEVPIQALTVGIATIMEARHLLLIATGKNKSSVIADTLLGPIGPHCPASFLREHPNFTCLLDTGAAQVYLDSVS